MGMIAVHDAAQNSSDNLPSSCKQSS